jgi:hypothetical protein
MNKSLIAASLACILFTGCKTTPALLTPAAVTQEVALGVRVGLDVYPQATAEVALARDVICAAAAVTNINPSAIIADLATLNITNAESKLIVDAALLVYENVYALIDTNSTVQVQPYSVALCNGLTQGLPPVTSSLMRVNAVSRQILPPHLK